MIAVFLLLAVAWAAVLVPPAIHAHGARQEAFLDSLADTPAAGSPPGRPEAVQRRRRIAGGLLVAMAATLLGGLLPTFRVLLYVHLFLVDSFIAYIALLAHMANKAAPAVAPVEAAEPAPEAEDFAPAPSAERVCRWRRPQAPVRVLPELRSIG